MWGQGRQAPRTTSEDQLHYDDDGDGDGGEYEYDHKDKVLQNITGVFILTPKVPGKRKNTWKPGSRILSTPGQSQSQNINYNSLPQDNIHDGLPDADSRSSITSDQRCISIFIFDLFIIFCQ